MNLEFRPDPGSPALVRQAAAGAGLLAGLAGARLLELPLGPFGIPARNFLPHCLVHQLTGHPCPTCGMTRSFIAMSRGDLGAALLWHPLGPALFGAAGLAGVALLAGAACSRRWRVNARETETKAATIGLAGVLLAAWVVRWMGGF